MKTKIKTKVSLGMVLLFIVISLVGGVGIYSINRLASDSKAILKANYESLQFGKNMQEALDGYESGDSLLIKKFEENLIAQERNITEVGEQEVTNEIRSKFETLSAKGNSINSINQIRSLIYKVAELNMNAIVRKSNEAQQTADKAKVYLAIIGTLAFLISFSFLLNFPGYIANPIRQLTEGIKEISNKNYSQRIHLKSGDEFGELASSFNAMAEKLDAYENSNLAKIIFEKKRIDTIINNMKDPIFGFDEKRNILFANSAAIKVIGVEENELIGKYGPDVALRNDLLRNLLNAESGITPLKIFADNKESYFAKEVLQIMSDNQPIGEVVMLKNITQFKELDLAKTNFIATVSHELKTPLASIKMSLALLEDKRVGELNQEQDKLVSHIKDDSQRLLKITGELLDLAQVETGNIQLHKDQVEPRAIMDYAINALKVQAEQKKVVVDVKCDESLPKVNCDLEKTSWVLVNLLSNAIRYSPEQSHVLVELTAANESVVFSVKDSGKGIDPKYKTRVFEKFYKIPDAYAGNTGTGLGLAISKEFIIAQGGEIWMESELNQGSKFSFLLKI